jgi:predicted pyridoxine 5'-phosphate oxidase superfamily flavin-nucleotide-binding protein
MPDSVMFHDGNRQLQDRFDSRRISDRLEEKLTRKEFTADDKAFIEGLPYFFLATSDAQGRPDCSFKGGPPGFVRVTGPSELAFPDYDGNGMFKSLGNILVNPEVGLLFIAMHGKPRRLRVNGRASIGDRDPLLSETVGAQLIVRVTARAIFPNCPRYIPATASFEPSIYTPRAGEDAPEPAWKGFADFKDFIHPRQPTFKG